MLFTSTTTTTVFVCAKLCNWYCLSLSVVRNETEMTMMKKWRVSEMSGRGARARPLTSNILL